MTPPIIKATIAAVSIVVHRLTKAIDDDDLPAALEDALVLEHGANLLTIALAKQADINPDTLQQLRDDLANTIHNRPHNQPSLSDAAATNFLNQRRNASNN